MAEFDVGKWATIVGVNELDHDGEEVNPIDVSQLRSAKKHVFIARVRMRKRALCLHHVGNLYMVFKALGYTRIDENYFKCLIDPNSEAYPDDHTMCIIAEVLGVHPAWLAGLDHETYKHWGDESLRRLKGDNNA